MGKLNGTGQRDYALQVRLSEDEVAQLDLLIEKIRSETLGGSGVSRSTVMRDLLVAELKKHKAKQ